MVRIHVVLQFPGPSMTGVNYMPSYPVVSCYFAQTGAVLTLFFNLIFISLSASGLRCGMKDLLCGLFVEVHGLSS